MKSSKLHSIKLNHLFTVILAATLTACGSGGGGGLSGGSGGGGGSTSLNIQSVGTISPLNTTYSPSCIYEYGNIVSIVNANGSGTGYNLNLSSGQVSQVTGLPQVNLANGDQCLSNYQQLTWINYGSPYVVNVFDPDKKQTVAVNLGQSGVSGSDIAKSSFSLATTVIFANNNFLNNGSFGFSNFVVPNPTSYTQLDNSLYANQAISNVLYGFDGAGGQFVQLFPTDLNLNQPAGLAYIQTGSGLAPVQHLSPITDSNNQPISAMSTAWDFTSGGNGVILTTGSVQPVLFKCPLTGLYAYQCNKSYTGAELTSKYRIMRLLGGNANYVYFMGMDLTKSDIEIFSMQL